MLNLNIFQIENHYKYIKKSYYNIIYKTIDFSVYPARILSILSIVVIKNLSHAIISSAPQNWNQNRSFSSAAAGSRRVAVATLETGAATRPHCSCLKRKRDREKARRRDRQKEREIGQPIQMSQSWQRRRLRQVATPIEMDSGWDRIR